MSTQRLVPVRVTSIAVATAILAIAVTHPVFRHPEGHLGAAFCLPIALSFATLMIGFTASTVWALAGRWVALAGLGQAAALQLVHAGNVVSYQHYPVPAELYSSAHVLPLLLLAAQAVIVTVAAGHRLADWLRTLRDTSSTWRIAAVAGIVALTSATLSLHPTDYLAELVFATFVELLSLATIVLAAAALPQPAVAKLRAAFDRVLGARAGSPEPRGPDRFAVIVAAWVLVACAVLAWFSYQAHPHVPDEVVYLYHARYFARGMLSMPLPPVPQAFNLDLMTFEATRWYSPVPPGWPAALAVGAFFGAAWIVNPVLNAINVLLAYVVLRELYDRRTARIGLLLLGASPWFLLMGMNFMTHTFTMTCALGAAIGVARLRRGCSLLWTLPAGVAIGMLGMIRPLEGLTVALLLGFWALGAFPWSASRFARVTVLAIVSIAAGAVVLPYNAHLAGDPTVFPLMAYTDSIYGAGTNALGFGADRGLGWPGLDPIPGHGAIDVLVNGNLNAFSVNIELLGWSVGSLLPIALLVMVGRLARADAWLLIAIGAIIGVHSLYWFSGGPDFGARYWYLILFPCIALVARAAVAVPERIAQLASHRAADVAPRALAGVLALSMLAVICFIPWRAIDKYYHYRNMRPDVRRLAADHDFGRSLVLVRGKRHPDYASAAIYNPLDLTAPVPIYVWDRDAAITRDALAEYADRPVWIIEGPTLTGDGFRILSGPVQASRVTPATDSIR